jgi:hypothetical protein
MNAAHANQNALDNASPNSRLGQLKTFQVDYAAAQAAIVEAEAVVATAEGVLALAQANLATLQETDPLDYVSVEGETYDEAVIAAQGAVDDATRALATAQSGLTAAQLAADAVVDTLTGGEDLSEAAFAELLSMLGL